VLDQTQYFAQPKDKKIYITGGDGALIAACLKQAEFDENLVFKSMERIVKKEILC